MMARNNVVFPEPHDAELYRRSRWSGVLRLCGRDGNFKQ
jgi:hypothetical protein